MGGYKNDWDVDAKYIASITDIELFEEVKSFDALNLAGLALAMPASLLTEIFERVARVQVKNPLSSSGDALNLPLHWAM
jgi:hypothetical protein